MADWEFPNPVSDVLQKALEPQTAMVRSREARIQELEDEVHEEAATIIADALAFADLPEGAEHPPDEWIDKYGPERAQKRFNVAKYAQCTPKNAPVGLRIANNALVGMAKAKAHRKSGPRTLNMIVVQMTGPVPQYDELEVAK